MKLMFVFAILVTFISCKNKPSPSATTDVSQVDTASKAYFPVQDFLKGEIRYVDSLPVGIMKYTTKGSRTDSVYIKIQEFNQLAENFLSAELESGRFENGFKEISFYDPATKYATFTYSPKTENGELKRVDVISKSGNQYDRINSIYMEKIISMHGAATLKRLYWKAGSNFQIIQPDSIGNQSVTKVVWNYWD